VFRSKRRPARHLFDKDNLNRLAGVELSSFALEAAPRTTRVQGMDVLSSRADRRLPDRDDGRRQAPALVPDANFRRRRWGKCSKHLRS
jgi:hypothetical protein